MGRDSELASLRGRVDELERALERRSDAPDSMLSAESVARQPGTLQPDTPLPDCPELGTDAASKPVPGFDTEESWRDYSSVRQGSGQQDLSHVARIAMLGEMTAGLAHDLSQPVTSIQSFVFACQQCLSNEPLDRISLESHLEHIRHQAEQASRIIDRVRSFARNASPRLSPQDLNHLVREALTLLECDARFQGVTVQTDLDSGDPVVEVDAVSIEQVILNLLRNACEAMAESSSKTRRIVVRTIRSSTNETEVSISDTGPGMSPEATRNAFFPFFTTKKDGLGMGLAISRSIIDFHRGTLVGERNPEGGMTFRFVLPAFEENPR